MSKKKKGKTKKYSKIKKDSHKLVYPLLEEAGFKGFDIREGINKVLSK
ncbi:MAG: hypothetical protein AAGF07_01075 [Patescibacteria group bacterium]